MMLILERFAPGKFNILHNIIFITLYAGLINKQCKLTDG